ncbi:MAG: YbfB/YjiJ family MFS transporter, partial [Polaromonas sp.]
MADKETGQGTATEASPWTIVVAGMMALAAAMGIGRFAFTPLLPMMLSDGVIDLAGASWLASANYFGYLVGALLCTFQPLIWRRFDKLPQVGAATWVRVGLAGTCVLTLGMALHLPALWPVLRFLAGVASAFVFVFNSGWVLAQLAKRGASPLGGAMYAGPGAGIAISGLLATGMVAMHWTAAMGWLVFGLLACVLTAIVWPTFHKRAEKQNLPAPVQVNAAGPATQAASAMSSEVQ